MWISIWSSDVKNIYIWNTEIKEVYHWSTKIWPSTYSSWIYWNQQLWLISASSDWKNWITISDKNLWASTVYNSWDTVNAANTWWFYQWWNNYAFPYTWATDIVTSTTNASAYWPNNYYSSSTFRNIQSSHWDSSLNADLWWDNTNTLKARKWPCDTWWHVPTINEWFDLLDIWESLWARWARPNVWTNLSTKLKLPIVFLYQWTTAYTFYWCFVCSSFWNYKSMQDGDQLMITSSWTSNVMNMATVWACLRPFKNSPVIPDDTWTQL